jgi:hypothetical protein
MRTLDRGGLRLAAAAITLAALAAGGSQVAWAQEAEEGQVSFRPPRGAMIAPGPAADLTLLYTGDVIGYVDPCG